MTVDLATKVKAIQAFMEQYVNLEDAARIEALLAVCMNSNITNGSSPVVEKEKAPRKTSYNRGPYKYIRGLAPDVERMLRKPEFIGRNLGIDYPKELTAKLREIGAISLEHTEEHIRKTLADKIGAKKMFILQANGKLNLYSNITKDPSDAAPQKSTEIATAK